MLFNLKSKTICSRIPMEEEAFQDYSVKGTLGSGAYGSIFKARHKESGTKVALKIIEDIFQSEVLVRSVVREVSILRQLTKMYFSDGAFQHTVLLHDFILYKTEDGKIGAGLCLDYHRHDLADELLQAQSPLSTEQLTKLLYSILCGLNFLHSAGVMHRDVKPDNYLIGRHGRLYLCDFGLARSVISDDLHIHTDDSSREQIIVDLGLTKRQRMKRPRELSPRVCSRSYRPPEVILLNRRYDQKVDLWSAGCLMLKTLSSQNLHEKEPSPFAGASCFPLSPRAEDASSSADRQDVLDRIIEVFGMPSELDCAFLTHESQMEHLLQHQTEAPGRSLYRMYPDANSELLIVIEDLLQFNPYFRQSAARLLEAQLFDSVRDEEMEAKAPSKIVLDMDGPREFDYQFKTSNLKATSNYLEMLLEEQSLVIQQQVDHLQQQQQ